MALLLEELCMAFLDHCIYDPTIGGIISDTTIIMIGTCKGGKKRRLVVLLFKLRKIMASQAQEKMSKCYVKGQQLKSCKE